MTDTDIVRLVALLAKSFHDQRLCTQLQDEQTRQWYRYSGSFSPSSMSLTEQGPQGTVTIRTTGTSTVQVYYDNQLAAQISISGTQVTDARSQQLSYERFTYFDVSSSTVTIRGNQSYRFQAY